MMADPRRASASSLPVMQDDSVRWNGQPVALVVAETQEQADHAASLIRIDYAHEAAALSLAAKRSKAHAPENILGQPSKIAIGDAEAALAAAAFRVDHVYRTPRHNHCAIKLHGVTAAWQGDSLLVHDATQMVQLTRSTLATVFGIADDKVRVKRCSGAPAAARSSAKPPHRRPRR